MHLQECLHPKRIYNPYTQEWTYVPCGKCPSCLRSRANKWIERLNVERKCWKYCVFFTLTYANEFVPTLKKLGNDYLIDPSHLHQSPDDECPVIALEEVRHGLSEHELINFSSYLQKNDVIHYLSVYDAQCFVKRLRKNLFNTIKKSFTDYEQKDYQVRYYIIGEYGSWTKRPHYHGLLFFSSEKEASCIQSVISKSWQFGITDSSFVAESNASYVAKYVNSLSDLPPVLKLKGLRPFSIFSKLPPLGTLYFNEEAVRNIFTSCSPRMLVDYFKGTTVSDVPLWRTYQDRLFPKLSGYSKFSPYDRTLLYRAVANLTNKLGKEFTGPTFVNFMLDRYHRKRFDQYYLHVYDDYIDFLFEQNKLNPDFDYMECIKRWYFVSSRVCTQSAAFDFDLSDYVENIDTYYKNLESDMLKGYFDFQKEYAKENPCTHLVGLDRLWLESVLDLPFYLLDVEEQKECTTILTQLKSFGIDIDKFYSPDDDVRESYQWLLLPYNQRDYQIVCDDANSWLHKATKVKSKNDYLMAHEDELVKTSDYCPF